MTKNIALHKITQFGRSEQHALIEAGKHHEAYQIEHARNRLLYALVVSIKEVRRVLPLMIDGGETDEAVILRVADERTHDLLSAFAADF